MKRCQCPVYPPGWRAGGVASHRTPWIAPEARDRDPAEGIEAARFVRMALKECPVAFGIGQAQFAPPPLDALADGAADLAEAQRRNATQPVSRIVFLGRTHALPGEPPPSADNEPPPHKAFTPPFTIFFEPRPAAARCDVCDLPPYPQPGCTPATSRPVRRSGPAAPARPERPS